jgi:hypothetical protein
MNQSPSEANICSATQELFQFHRVLKESVTDPFLNEINQVLLSPEQRFISRVSMQEDNLIPIMFKYGIFVIHTHKYTHTHTHMHI